MYICMIHTYVYVFTYICIYIYINIYIFIYCIYCKYIYLTNPSVHWQNPEWSSNYRWTKQYDLLPVILTKTCGEQHQSHCSVTVTVITGTNKTAHTMGNHQRSRLSFLSLSFFFFFFFLVEVIKIWQCSWENKAHALQHILSDWTHH